MSTDAAVTEILVLLGAADRLVAIDASSNIKDRANLPRLGYHRALAIEGLLALSPDLIIGSQTMGPAHVLDQLNRAQIPIMKLPTPSSIQQLRANITDIAQRVGGVDDELVLTVIDTTTSNIRQLALPELSGAFLLRGEGGKLRLAGKETAGFGFLGLLGVSTVADFHGYRSVTSEGVLELNPDILIITDTQGAGHEQLLETFPLLRFSNAVQTNRLFSVNPDTLVAGISPSALHEAERILRSELNGQQKQALSRR
ncbi:MAG: hemin ABC transporter substrate-binding protein [bacterium]